MRRHADELYEAIRADNDDLQAIALNTGLKRANVVKVKEHLFHRTHWRDLYVELGVPGEWGRFDSDHRIADAWNRLLSSRYQPGDIQLLRHETAEAWFMRKHGPSYRLAHQAATRRFPWHPNS